MTSKIEGLQTGASRPAGAASSASQASRSQKSGNTAATADDSVSLSGTAGDIAALARQLGATPAFDQAKVDAVKLSVESGNYQIDSQAIARKLVQSESDLRSGR